MIFHPLSSKRRILLIVAMLSFLISNQGIGVFGDTSMMAFPMDEQDANTNKDGLDKEESPVEKSSTESSRGLRRLDSKSRSKKADDREPEEEDTHDEIDGATEKTRNAHVCCVYNSDGVCARSGQCCNNARHCCSGYTCRSGKCVIVSPCSTLGQYCGGSRLCCSGLTCQRGKCRKPISGCLLEGEICSTSIGVPTKACCPESFDGFPMRCVSNRCKAKRVDPPIP